MKQRRVLHEQCVRGRDRLTRADRLVGDAAERDHRRPGALGAEARERLGVAPFLEGGQREHLGGRDDALAATTVDAYLEHGASLGGAGARGIGCLFGRAAGKLLTRNVGRGGCAGAATARSSGPSNSRSLMSAVHTSATEAALRPFSDLARGDVDYAGGKGANLGELTGAGVPVPPGFVVGAPAYGAFCDEGGLRERIEERLHSIDVEDTAALEAASGDVRSMVESEPMPLALEAEIAAAYAELAGS